MKTFLVAGGAGFIGSNLTERLLTDGHKVICVDNLITGVEENVAHLLENKNFVFINHDVVRGVPAIEYVEAMWLMLQTDKPKDYVIGTNTSHSVEDAARIAFEHVGLNYKDHVVSNDKLHRPTEIKDLKGDYSLAKKDLGWEPKTSFEDLMKLMVDADLRRFK